MTDNTSLTNLALQTFGSRTVITAAQLAAGSNNEAKQSNLVFANCRDSLLRMAPWDCGMKTANLVYITSVPGTPENTSTATNLWQPGQPRPPWSYEYQYPVDCLKACWMIPSSQTGFTGVPITTAVTGGVPMTGLGGPVRFKVGVDEFYCAQAIDGIGAAGAGYTVDDILTIAPPTTTTARANLIGTFNADSPPGAAVKVRVVTVNGSGGITEAEVIPQLLDGVVGGSFFYIVPGFWPEESTSGAGSGATISFSIGTTVFTQRVILTNQQSATLCYVKQVTDPNVWDPQFQDAFVQYLGANMCYALTGDKALSNMCVNEANRLIMEARKSDGNEGLTTNNVTPDWIRARGYAGDDRMMTSPGAGFDWGGLMPGW